VVMRWFDFIPRSTIFPNVVAKLHLVIGRKGVRPKPDCLGRLTNLESCSFKARSDSDHRADFAEFEKGRNLGIGFTSYYGLSCVVIVA
jgi:hypothetical protein